MATRVNTKFVLVLCGVLLLLVGGVVGVWYVIESRSAERYVRLAEEARDAGDLRKAVSFYGRAVYRRPQDLQLLETYGDALLEAEVDSMVIARRYLQFYVGSKRQMAERSDYATQRVADYFDTLYNLGRRFRADSYYQQLVEQASNRLSSNPDNLVARKYRGLATLAGIARDTPADVRDRALDDLNQVVDSQDDPANADTRVLAGLAEWKLLEASRLDQPGDNIGDRPQEADQLREEAVNLATQMLQADAADPVRQLLYIQLLAHPALNPANLNPHPSSDAIRGVVDAFVAQADVVADRDTAGFIDVLDNLPRLYREPVEVNGQSAPEGMAIAQDALRRATQAHPDQLPLAYAQAEFLRRTGQFQLALDAYERIIAGASEADFLTFIEGQQYTPMAYYAKANLLLNGLENEEQQTQQAKLNQVEDIASDLSAIVGDESPLVDALRGKVALMRGSMARATALLDRASARMGDGDVELLVLSARARERSGQTGAAAARYEQLLQARPELHGIRADYARLLAQLNRPQDARRELATVLEAQPDNDTANRLLTALMLQSDGDQADQAIASLERAAEQGGINELVTLAAAYQQRGQNDQARQTVQQALAIDPAEPRAVRLAVRLQPDADARRQIVQAAGQAGMNPDTVDLMMSAIAAADSDDDASRRELIERVLSQNEDPVSRLLAEARLFIESDDPDDAQRGQAALDELIASHADHPSVIEFRFERALAQEDFDLAEKLVEQAEATDADLAEGEFFRARMLHARGQLQRAILTMSSALESRPVFSEGWLRLGRLYREAGQLDDAANALNRAIEQSPGNVAALITYSQTAAELGRNAEALDAARAAARRAPGNTEIQRVAMALEQQHGDVDRAIAQRRAWAQQFPDDVNNQRQLALALAKRGDVEPALEALEQSITDDIDRLDVVQSRAMIYSLARQPQKGLDVLSGYLRARGDSITTQDRLALARYFMQNGRNDLAARSLVQARANEDPQAMPASRALGDLLFNMGRNTQAAEIYNDVLAANPDDELVRLRLAETQLRLGDIDAAREALDSGEVADNSTATLVKALVAREAGELSTALRLINQLIAAEPERADLYTHRATIFARQDRTRTAREDLERSLSLDPDFTLARLTLAQMLNDTGNRPAAIDELQRLVARSPDFPAGHMRLAQTLIEAERPLDAEVVLINAVEQFPENPVWLRELAELAESMGDTREAVERRQQVLALSGDGRDYIQLIDALLADGRPAEVIARTDELEPQMLETPIIGSIRALALHRQGRSQQALNAFQAALASAESMASMTAVASRLVQAVPTPEAVSIIDAASTEDRRVISQLTTASLLVERDPADALRRVESVEPDLTDQPQLQSIANRTAGIAAYNAGDFTAARSRYEAILEDNPLDATTLNNLAYMLIQDMDQPEQGLEMAQRAARVLPRNGRVLDTVGLAQLKLGRIDQAIDTLNRSYRLEPLPVNALHLGLAYSQASRTADARAMLNTALELAGDDDAPDSVAQRARQALDQLND